MTLLERLHIGVAVVGLSLTALPYIQAGAGHYQQVLDGAWKFPGLQKR